LTRRNRDRAGGAAVGYGDDPSGPGITLVTPGSQPNYSAYPDRDYDSEPSANNPYEGTESRTDGYDDSLLGEEMPQCRSCREHAPLDAAFCPYCGQPLGGSSTRDSGYGEAEYRRRAAFPGYSDRYTGSGDFIDPFDFHARHQFLLDQSRARQREEFDRDAEPLTLSERISHAEAWVEEAEDELHFTVVQLRQAIGESSGEQDGFDLVRESFDAEAEAGPHLSRRGMTLSDALQRVQPRDRTSYDHLQIAQARWDEATRNAERARDQLSVLLEQHEDWERPARGLAPASRSAEMSIGEFEDYVQRRGPRSR
jgi:hypothetical protein